MMDGYDIRYKIHRNNRKKVSNALFDRKSNPSTIGRMKSINDIKGIGVQSIKKKKSISDEDMTIYANSFAQAYADNFTAKDGVTVVHSE